MVWAAIGFDRKSRLLQIKGSINSERYIKEILEVEAVPLVLEMPGYVFQQDNARCHSAKATMAYLDAMGVEVLAWPAKSPDLSPIEHLWDVLGRQIHDAYATPIENILQLQQRLLEQWDAIDQGIINTLCDSMIQRIRECITARGGHTS
jgi:hypothetical protein